MKVTEEIEVIINRIDRRIKEEGDSILVIRDQLIRSLQCSTGNLFAIASEVEVASKRMSKALAEIDRLKLQREGYEETLAILEDCGVE